MTDVIADPSIAAPEWKPARRTPVSRRLLKVLGWLVLVIVVIAAPILTYAGVLKLTGNIDVVDPGAVYRSGQLSGERLTQLITERKIRTVINLRGPNAGRPWYDEEARATQALGVTQIDLPMSATREPDPALLDRLVTTLKTAQKPFLIHCESGSDRTGLATALYRLESLKEAPDVAGKSLSFYWGHFPWLGSPTVAMDRTFESYVAARSGR